MKPDFKILSPSIIKKFVARLGFSLKEMVWQESNKLKLIWIEGRKAFRVSPSRVEKFKAGSDLILTQDFGQKWIAKFWVEQALTVVASKEQL